MALNPNLNPNAFPPRSSPPYRVGGSYGVPDQFQAAANLINAHLSHPAGGITVMNRPTIPFPSPGPVGPPTPAPGGGTAGGYGTGGRFGPSPPAWWPPGAQWPPGGAQNWFGPQPDFPRVRDLILSILGGRS